MIEPPDLVRFVNCRDGHHRHQDLVFPDLGRIAREQGLDRIGPRGRRDDIDPVARNVDARQALDGLVHLGDDDPTAKGRRLHERRRVLGIRAGIKVTLPVGLVRDHERHVWRQIDHHAGIELEIGVNRADLEPAGFDQLGELPALRAGEREIEPVRDPTLEDCEVIGQRQYRLDHMEAVRARRIRLCQRGSKQIGLLLIVALDRHAAARLDDRLEQLRRPFGRADFRARVIERRGTREAIVPIRRRSMRISLRHGPS